MFFVVESLRVDVFRRWLRSSSSRSVCLLKRYWSNFKAPLPKPLAVQFLFLLLFCKWATSSWIIKVRFDCVEKFASGFLRKSAESEPTFATRWNVYKVELRDLFGLLQYNKACCLAKVFYVARWVVSFKVQKETELNSYSSPALPCKRTWACTGWRIHATISI